MTTIGYGQRMEAVESFKQQFPGCEFVYFPDQTRGNQFDERDLAFEMMKAWKQSTIPPRHIVFIDPPKDLNPKQRELKPRPDRHILFDADKVPAVWDKWAEANSVFPQIHGVDASRLVQLLVAGNKEAGVPRFTQAAAEQFVASNPGGLSALANPIALLVASEAPEPIQLEVVLDLWPFSIKEGRFYPVTFQEFQKALGLNSNLGVSLALKIHESQAIPTLSVLKSTCKSNLKRVELIDMALAGMEKKFWTPQAALFLFALACKEEAGWPSLSKKSPDGAAHTSALQQLKASSRLSNIPCWLT